MIIGFFPMRRMGTRNFKSTPELHLVVLLLVPMRRMGTHPGCGASSSDSTQLPSIVWDGMRRISYCIPMRRMGTRECSNGSKDAHVLSD
jgi:hypothetical protein